MDIEPGIHAIPDKFWTFIEKEKSVTTLKHQVTKEKNENANKNLSEKKEESYFQKQNEEITKMYESNREDLKAYLRVFLGECVNDATFRMIEFPSSLDGNIRKIIHDIAEEFGLRHESEGGKKNRRLVVSRNEGTKKVKQDKNHQPNLSNVVVPSKVEEEKAKPSLTAEIEEAWKKANESERKMNDPVNTYRANKDMFYQEFKDVPDPITNVKFANLKKHSIEIIFEMPDANGYPIQAFALYFYDAAHSSWVEHARSKTNSFIVNDLLPTTIYTFRIGAFNELGESEFEKSFKFKAPDIFNGSALLSGANRYYDFHPGIFGDNVFTEDTEFVASFEPLRKLESRVLDVVPSFSKLALIDDGTVLQWGLTYIEEMDQSQNQKNQKDMKDEEEEEYALRNKKPDYISAITSAPFFVFNPDIEQAKDIIVSLACGLNFSLALTISGQVFSWGLNTVGQLGHGDCVPKCDPKRIEALSKLFIREISALKYNSMALTDEGRVYTWGERQSELGCDPIKNRFDEVIGFKDPLSICHTPREMTKLSTYDKIVKISAGGAFNAALNHKGELFTWGDNNHGQLGHGLIDDQKFEFINVPKKVDRFVELKAIVKDVSCGDHHMLAIVEFPEEMGRSAELWSWGFSAQGQCGHGDRGARIAPTQVVSMTEEVQLIAAGFKHSLIAGKSGAVYFCGRWDNAPKSASKSELEFDKPIKLSGQQCPLNVYGSNKSVTKIRTSKCNSSLILI